MVRSGQRRRSGRPTERWIAIFLISLLLTGPAVADELRTEVLDLQLDVSINGQPVNIIGAFQLDGQGRLWAAPAELREVGLDIGKISGDDLVALDGIAGLSYRYDEKKQAVYFTVDAALRRVKTYGGDGPDDTRLSDTAPSLVLNYSAFAEGSAGLKRFDTAIDGGSLSLEGRASSRFGTLSQSGIIGTTTFSDATALRLDTIWSYADHDNARSFRAGDIVTGGLSWTRPIRMGGVQVQRNFGLRPDLVTMPLPSFSGSAAVPSTVDVYVGSVKTYSQAIESGPYRIDSLPVITGSGTARVVVTDATGRESEQDIAFYTSANLLRRGLIDYSLEGGVARRDYGTDSFGYDGRPAVSGSLRYGITDWLTGEAHAETELRMANGGLGFVAGLGRFGEVSGAAAISHDGGFGALLYAGWDADFGNLNISASTRRSLGDYADLATVTGTGDDGEDPLFDALSRAVDQVTLSYGFPDLRASAGLGFVHVEDSEGTHSYVLSGSLTKAFDNKLSVYASGFADLADTGNSGAFLGLSMPFGTNYTAGGSASLTNGNATAIASLTRTGSGEIGGYGWRLAHGEGDMRYTDAAASYRAPVALLQAAAIQHGDNASFSLAADGAAVAAGGGLFLANRIDDAFAVVDTGMPGVPVRVENRPAGTTGSNGKLLVAGLNAYQKNKVSIDVDNLPVAADIPMTETLVVPQEKSGTLVDFGIRSETGAAIVVVTDGEGKPLPPGTTLTLDGGPGPLVVGFDGEVYMTGLTTENSFESSAHAASCHGSFAFKPGTESIPVIGPVPCV